MIKFNCTACAKKLSVRDVHAGRNVNCPGCGIALIVPPAAEIPQIAPTPLKVAAAAVAQAEPAPAAEPTQSPARTRMTPARRQLQRIAATMTVIGGLGLAFIAGLTMPQQPQLASNPGAPIAPPAAQTAPAANDTASPQQLESIRAALLAELQRKQNDAPVEPQQAETVETHIAGRPVTLPRRPQLKDIEPDEAPAAAKANADAARDGGDAQMLELLRKRTDEAKPAEAAPPAAKNPPAEAARANPPAAAPQMPAAPVALISNFADACTGCLSTGNVPLQHLPRYVRLERELAFMQHNPNAGLPWQGCRKCAATRLQQPDVAPKDSSQQAYDLHTKWERLAEKELLYAETRHVSIHSLAPEPFTRATADALDKLATQLQQLTGSTLLVQTRPHSHSLALGWEEHDYTLLSNVLRADGISFEYLPNSMNSVNTTRNCSLAYALRAYGGGLPWIPVVTFGQMLMREACDDKAPDWLVEGFGSYCESIMFNRQHYCVAPDFYQIRSGTWSHNLRQQCKNVPISWESIFSMRRGGAMSIQALGACVVSPVVSDNSRA